MPWLLLESILVLCVILGFWIEGKRSNVSSREMDGFGSGARSLAIVMMSFGPLGFLQLLALLYRVLEPQGHPN